MKLLNKILSFFMMLTIIVSALGTSAFGASGTPLDAEIEKVSGGANGIVSMTFDDGYYDSALVIEELCEKYDLEASLMMISNKLNTSNGTDGANAKWTELFAKGHLEPQSHSKSHLSLTAESTENLTPENIQSEIVESRDKIAACFPNHDIICYAIPYGHMASDALQVAVRNYYMIRSTYSDANQTLDPSTEFGIRGSWSQIYSPTTINSDPTVQITKLKGKIDTAAEGFWYCPITHRVGDDDGSEIPYAVLDEWFKYIDEVRDRGDVWVTTASKATKYIRERQNSVASAKLDDGVLSVRVDMAKTTADGLTLKDDVFNYPLTVKVEIPDGYETLSYTMNGECQIADVVTTGTERYAHVEVVPNTGDVVLTGVKKGTRPHTLVPIAMVSGSCIAEGTVAHLHCSVCNNNYSEDGKRLDSLSSGLGEHKLESIPGKNPTCTESGIIAHKHCTLCNNNYSGDGKRLYSTVTRAAPHTLEKVAKKEATCTAEGNIAHEHCSVCEKNFSKDGEELESVIVEKLAHNTVDLASGKSVSDASGRIAIKHCTVCNTYFDALGEALDASTLKSESNAGLIIMLTAIGTVLAGAGIFTFILVKKRNRAKK